ncbi:cupin domain-containing protein [Cyclobacteriaceae bacterium]|jgi:quercetin dioxygenase-like cupin family protein|nr:cupin domain-containing protein [Cyclobacteriaceae bacterium]|tara:strand:- start:357 stop:698 length:342 start_codon:yes stop_codon:yes gene_type:complete
MQIYNLEKIKVITPMAGFSGRMVHTRDLTIVYWEIDKDSVLPLHKHLNTQTTHVVSGKLELSISGVTRVFNAGELVVIDSYEPHCGKALTPCSVIDTFAPVREDYKELSDALI